MGQLNMSLLYYGDDLIVKLYLAHCQRRFLSSTKQTTKFPETRSSIIKINEEIFYSKDEPGLQYDP